MFLHLFDIHVGGQGKKMRYIWKRGKDNWKEKFQKCHVLPLVFTHTYCKWQKTLNNGASFSNQKYILTYNAQESKPYTMLQGKKT
jgi:hypothetical protein